MSKVKSEHSRQVIRRLYRDAALTKIPQSAKIGATTVILGRKQRRKIAKELAKRKQKADETGVVT
jgi:hypothetical protein